MKKRVLLLLVVVIGMTTSAGWAQPPYKDAVLNSWEKDRTEPKSWNISDGWITFSTNTEPNNNWYSWHGKKTEVDMDATNVWFVETQLKLTDKLLGRDGVRTSIWLNVVDAKGQIIDWPILQFKIDDETKTKGWQSWVSSGNGSWVDVPADKNIPVSEGTYTLKIAYKDGMILQYINGIEANSYKISEDYLSCVKEIIINSYSYGESYSVEWKVPEAKYAKSVTFVSTADELIEAVASEAVTTIVARAGEYVLSSSLTINRDLTIEGEGASTIIKAAPGFAGTGSGKNYVINIIGGTDVQLKNLKVQGNGVPGFGGINTWGTTAKLTDITVEGNQYMGIVVGKNATVTTEAVVWNDNLYGLNVYLGENPNNGKTELILSGDKNDGIIYTEQRDVEYIGKSTPPSINVTTPEGWKCFLIPTQGAVWKKSNVPDIQNSKITLVPSSTDFVDNGITLQEAIEYAALVTPKPEIILPAGTYQGSFVMRPGVNVTGLDFVKTILQAATTPYVGSGDKAGRVVSAASAFTEPTAWRNLTIQNGSIDGVGAGALITNNITLTNCIIKNNYASSATGKGGGVMCDHGGVVDNCSIFENTAEGGASGIALNFDGMIRNSLIYSNEAVGSSLAAAVLVDQTSTILNCTVWDNKAQGGNEANVEIIGDATITNTLMQTYTGTSANITYSASKSAIAGNTNIGLTDDVLAGNKLFADSVSGNYTPAINAIYVDKGVIGSWTAKDKDLANRSRIQGGNIDMGAYESSLVENNPIRITSLPGTIAYGDTIKLASNYGGAVFSLDGANADYVKLIERNIDNAKDTALVALKPGTAALKVATADGSKSAIHPVVIVKRTLQVKGLVAKKQEYNGTKDIAAFETKDVVVSGSINEKNVTANTLVFTGKLVDADAGNAKPVVVTTTFAQSSSAFSDYYEIEPITYVTDTVSRKALTISAVLGSTSTIDYGSSIPSSAFGVEYDGFVASEAATYGDLSGALKYNCAATSSSLAGIYPVTPYGYASNNYAIQYKSADLTIRSINPTVSIVSTTVSPDKKKVSVVAKVTNNGGTPTTSFAGYFTMDGTTDVPATSNEGKADEDGLFSADLTLPGNAVYAIAAKATYGGKEGATAATSIDAALAVQTIAFGTMPDKFVYGTAPLMLPLIQSQADAAIDYKSDAEEVATVDKDGNLTFHKVGKANIVVTAGKAGFMEVSAQQAIEVTPKTLAVVKNSTEIYTRVYNGTTSVSGIKNYLGLSGLVNNTDDVSIEGNPTASFMDKNVGTDKPISISTLTLTGAQAGNYTLIQPTDIIGKITPAAAPVIRVSNVSRRYNELALSYDLNIDGLVSGENMQTAELYKGAILVKEDGGNYSVQFSDLSFHNYETPATPARGTVRIVKDTPKVITYNKGNTVYGKVTDNGGWALPLEEFDGSTVGLDIVTVGSQSYASVTYGEGTVQGNMTATTADLSGVEWSVGTTFSTASAKRSMTKATTIGELKLEYGQSVKVACANAKDLYIQEGDKDILTLTKVSDNEVIVKAIGYGNGEAAVFANVGTNATAYLKVTLLRKSLTLDGTDGFVKTYDGKTSVSPSLSLSGVLTDDAISLDLDGVTFSFDSATAGTKKNVIPSASLNLKKDAAGKYNNYELKQSSLSGHINPAELTITSSVSKYYDGLATVGLSHITAENLVAGDDAKVSVQFATTGVGETIALSNYASANPNYTLASGVQPATGSVLKSTMLVELPESATDEDNLKENVTFTLQETGMSGIKLADYKPAYNETNGKINVSGGNTGNYAVVYNASTVTKTTSGGGGGTETPTTITLNVVTKTLQTGEVFTLVATVTPSDKSVLWSSSNEAVATVSSNGEVEALKAGKAIITATADGVSATCEITVEIATGLEDILADTRVYAKEHAICILPTAPVQALVVNMNGVVVYNATIAGETLIPVAQGVYIVKLGNGKKQVTQKVRVR